VNAKRKTKRKYEETIIIPPSGFNYKEEGG